MEKRWVMDIWEKQGWEKQQGLSYTGLVIRPQLLLNHKIIIPEGTFELSWEIQFALNFLSFPMEVWKNDKENPGLLVSSSMAEHPLVKFLPPEQEP